MDFKETLALMAHHLLRRQRQRRNYCELSSLDDRTLNDIGIRREQIPRIVVGEVGVALAELGIMRRDPEARMSDQGETVQATSPVRSKRPFPKPLQKIL